MPSDSNKDDESKREIDLGWQRHDSKTKSSEDKNAKKLLQEMKRLGLDPSGLRKFTLSLHKLAVASGVSSARLTGIIKELDALCEGKKISLTQASDYIQQLSERQRMLLTATEDLENRKKSLEVQVSLKELEYSASKDTMSEFARIKQDLHKRDLSFTDLSKLIALITAAEQVGYASSVIIETLSNLKSKEEKKKEIDIEIESLLNSKRTLQDKLLGIEQEISDRQQTLKSAEELRKLGFDFKDLDALQSAIRMISQTRNIDITAAKTQLLSDLEQYYANDHELKKRIRIMESLLKEKEEKFNMLEADYQNEKAILDNAKQLISSGLNEQWLKKLQTLIDAYGIDLDSLAGELKQYQSLNLSLINQLIVRSSRTSPYQASAPSPMRQAERDELSELMRAANNEDIDVEKFRISAQKAIEIICSKLPKNSPARLVLEHAQLAFKRKGR
ncbi:MAG: hypothetical protein AUH37_01600 [Candidatus Nitrososphaera sp. 13_1_40CM_48_12]|nr:MAG: hypothetical protein AUH37_01600 [Candidatus Nitrososphaera sp. 13_1_40CM_48_12]